VSAGPASTIATKAAPQIAGADARYHSADHGQRAIERTITVPADLTPDQRERLADIVERTPVTLALRRGTPITTTFHPA
jgi:hypothetical protein